MYQYGQGVSQNDAEALRWYQLSADAGNSHGKNNLQAFTDDLDGRGVLENAINTKVDDPALLRAQRWADIRDLRARITGLESDAVNQDDLANQLENMDKGKKDFVSKTFKAMGNVGAVKFHLEAAKYRAEAARLRNELAKLEGQGGPGPPAGPLRSSGNN